MNYTEFSEKYKKFKSLCESGEFQINESNTDEYSYFISKYDNMITEGILGNLLSFLPGTNAKKAKGLAEKITALYVQMIKFRGATEKKAAQDQEAGKDVDMPRLKQAIKVKEGALKDQINALQEQLGLVRDDAKNESVKQFIDMLKIKIKLESAKEEYKWAQKEEQESISQKIKTLDEKLKKNTDELEKKAKETSKKDDSKEDKSKDDSSDRKEKAQELKDRISELEKKKDELNFDLKDNKELEHDTEFIAKKNEIDSKITGYKAKIKDLENPSKEKESNKK